MSRLSAYASAAATVMTVACASICCGQKLTAVEAQVIAREAYVYGYPIVENYKTMYEFAINKDGEEFKAPFNTLKHRNHHFTPADTSVVTPNVDVSYSVLWMDLRTEPLVLGVPEIDGERYYSIQLVDLYKYTFGYIGSRATGNKSGRYLIAGPRWEGDAPEKVDKIIRSETDFALAVYRTQIRGPDDVENVKKIQKQYTVATLSKSLGQARPEAAIKLEFPQPDLRAKPDSSFFSTLNFLLKFCPPHASEKDIRKELARIGVKAGVPFNIDAAAPEIRDALIKGMEEGDAAITAAASKLKVAEVIGTRKYLGNDHVKRAVAAKVGRFSNAKEEALYPLYLSDAEGKRLDASKAKYVLRLSEKDLPPVNAFWSITVYDGKTNALVANPISRYRISSLELTKLVRDVDGQLTVYIQHESPREEQAAANWLPAPNGPFYMVMRLYWPKPAAYDGSWTPPLVWPHDSEQPISEPKPAGAEAAEEVKPSVLVDEPKPEMERPTIWGEPTEVQIAIFVIDVDEINSADQSFAASVYYIAKWKNQFLRHKGPGPIHRGLTEVWNPRLTIVGQQAAWRSYPESVEIQPDGTVTYRQKVWGRFSQPLMLQDFPFDQQKLSIHMVAAGLMEKHVKIVSLVMDSGRTSGIAQKFSLPDFDVVSWKAEPTPYFPVEGDVGVTGYEMKLAVARQSTYYVLKVIIPLCLIVIMSWLPRWIDSEQTGTNIGISTSAFLTLVAYLFAITVLLPRVSYVTRMDRFILLSTLMVFGGLIHTVVSTFLMNREKRSLVDRIERWSRFVYPSLLFLVLAISFLI